MLFCGIFGPETMQKSVGSTFGFEMEGEGYLEQFSQVSWAHLIAITFLLLFFIFFLENIIPAMRKNWKKTIWNLIPLLLTVQNYHGFAANQVFDEYKAYFVLLVNCNIAHVTLNLMLAQMARREPQVFPPAPNGNSMTVITVTGIVAWLIDIWIMEFKVANWFMVGLLQFSTFACLFWFEARVAILAI